MKFKLLLTLLVCLALICCFASCGNDDSDGDSVGDSVGEEVYTVTFKTNCQAVVKPEKVENGKKVPQPEAIVNPGYTFLGWYYGDEKWSFAGHTVTDDMTLEARWFANENYLTLDRNGAPYEAISGTSFPIKTGETKNLMKNPFKWNDRKFLGWSTTPDGPVEYLDGAPYTMGTESTKLYAVWDRTTSTVIFDGNGAESGAMIDAVIRNGAKANLPKNTYVRQGYAFKGWSTTKDGAVAYLDGAEYLMGSDDIYTLYAVWEPIGFVITYHCNGGEANPQNPITFTAEDLPIKLSDLNNQPNRLFNYWYLESDFSGSPVLEITEAKSVTLYAEFVDGTDGLTFKGSGNESTVTDYDGDSSELIIPSKYKGKTVTKIYKEAFKGNTVIKSVTLPSSITSIGTGAFWNCTNLESIEVAEENQYYKSIDGNLYSKDGKTFIQYALGKKDVHFVVGNGVTTIEKQAFSKCQYCTVVLMLDGVTKIGDRAFSNCPNLLNVVIPESVTIVGEVICIGSPAVVANCAISEEECTWPSYWKEENSIVVWDYNNNKVASDGYIYVVQDNVRYALKDGKATVVRQGKNITKAVIASSVNYGGQKYPVTSIVDYAFSECNFLTEAFVPLSITSMGEKVFYSCDCLVLYCEAAEEPSEWDSRWDTSDFRFPVVWDCKNNDMTYDGRRYTIVDGIRYVIQGEEAYVINQLSNIVEAVIPESIDYKGQTYPVVQISYEAFESCKNLTRVVIPRSVRTISMRAFYNCTELESIIIPSSVTNIMSYVFEKCENLTIYCEASSRPSGWNYDWNNSNCPVVWDYKE